MTTNGTNGGKAQRVYQTLAILLGIYGLSEIVLAPKAERTVREIVDPLTNRVSALEGQVSALNARISLMEELLREVREATRQR